MTLTARMSLKTTLNSYTKEKTVFVPLEIQEEDKIACLNLLPIKSKGTAEFQRMETRKRSVWYQRGCNTYWHISSASRKNVPARRCGRSIHVENNVESTQQSGHIKIWKTESFI
jgi:hypothetical protein